MSQTITPVSLYESLCGLEIRHDNLQYLMRKKALRNIREERERKQWRSIREGNNTPHDMVALSYIYLCNFKIEFRVFAFSIKCVFEFFFRAFSSNLYFILAQVYFPFHYPPVNSAFWIHCWKVDSSNPIILLKHFVNLLLIIKLLLRAFLFFSAWKIKFIIILCCFFASIFWFCLNLFSPHAFISAVK